MPKSIPLYVGEMITSRRGALGQSKSALARALGVRHPTVYQAEHGGRCVTVETLCRYAVALQCEPADLLPRLAELDGMIGMAGVDRLPKVDRPTGDEYVAAVVAGARVYHADHGMRPRTDGGDASGYVGFDTTWSAINFALARGSNGVEAVGGIHSLLDMHGIGSRRRGRR